MNPSMQVAGASSPWLLPAVSLWKREVVRFLRQRSRIIGALGTPLVFWVLVGSGLRNSVRVPGSPGADGDTNYLQYAFPGTIAMIVLFTAIFSMISVIEDRREGFLQAVIASPVRRSAVVFGKVLGSTTLAVGQSILFLLLAPLVGVPLSVASFVAVFGVLVVMSIGLSGLGLLIAWPMDSTQGFHAVMNLFLLPMWLLSGAFFPASGASRWVGWVMAINPLTYGVAALRHAMYSGIGADGSGLPSTSVSVGMTILFAAVTLFIATYLVSGRK